METNPTYYIDLITRYLAGEADKDDLVFLEKWLAAGPENRKIFAEYEKTWMGIERSKIESSVDLDKEWEKLNAKIEEARPKVISINRERNKRTNYILAIAAMIILVVVPVYVLFFLNDRPRTKFMEAGLEVTNGMLPDGSAVTLNRGAILEYPSRFKKGERHVKLTGEAYFEVKHDETKPFIITSGDVRVEVLGTSFYVNTDKASGKMEVILNSGKVKVYFSDDPDHGVILTPGQKAEVTRDSRKIVTDVNEDENYLSWKTGRLVFNNTPLIEITRVLQNVYHTEIELGNESVSHCLVTATFENQSLDAVLNVLKATLNIKIFVSGQKIIITGDACK
jgi:ferric-dicitrate binding protein FerR (iron transport regulator)